MTSTADVVAEQRRLGRLLGAGHELSARSWLFDVLIALVFIAVGYLLLQFFTPRADLDDALLVALVNAPLAIRRRFPRIAFGLVMALGILHMLLGVPIGLHDAGMLFAIYSAVGHTNRRFGLVVLVIGGVAVLVGAATAGPLVRMLSSLGAAGLVLAAWALGERRRSSRLGVLALQERAAQVEREGRQQAELAAAAERARIAREMHDVIAHGLSVMIEQADGAGHVVDQQPDRAREALAEISRTGRQSLAEMRNLVGLLRNDAQIEDGTGADLSQPGLSQPGLSQPGLADLTALLTESRTAGAEVTLTETGDRRTGQSMVELTAYRILQEGLTNARKHGGGRVEITLRHRTVENGRDGLSVEVCNDARASGANLARAHGHGLTGMAERVAAVEGTLALGPTKDGGFDLVAWLPYRETGAVGAGA